jgi:hypothetical protein
MADINTKALAAAMRWADARQRRLAAETDAQRALNSTLESVDRLVAKYDALVDEKARAQAEGPLSTKALEKWTRQLALAEKQIDRAIDQAVALVAA